MRKMIRMISSIVVLGLSFSAVAVAQEGQGMANRMAEMMDEDGDGKITKEEFMKDKEEMFVKLDKDSDEVLSADEQKEMMKMCMQRRQKMMGKGNKKQGMMERPGMKDMRMRGQKQGGDEGMMD